jgi:hypothetical protein
LTPDSVMKPITDYALSVTVFYADRLIARITNQYN